MMTISPSKHTQIIQRPHGILGSYQVLLYGRALHPEPFQLKARRVVRESGYECEGWLMRGSHVLRFQTATMCCSELVTNQERNLPTSGIVTAFLCAGEHEFDHDFGPAGVKYYTSVQTETLTENLYEATYAELLTYGKEQGGLIHAFEDEAGACLGILCFEQHAKSIHVDAFHLLAKGGVVVRTQTLFEMK